MAASQFLAGYNGATSVTGLTGSVFLPLISWTLNRTAKIVDFNNSMTGPTPVRDAYYQDVTGTLTIDRDFNNNPNAVMIQGTTLGLTTLYERTTTHGGSVGGPAHILSGAIIESAPVECNVLGKVGYRYNFKISGTYMPPGS